MSGHRLSKYFSARMSCIRGRTHEPLPSIRMGKRREQGRTLEFSTPVRLHIMAASIVLSNLGRSCREQKLEPRTEEIQPHFAHSRLFLSYHEYVIPQGTGVFLDCVMGFSIFDVVS